MGRLGAAVGRTARTVRISRSAAKSRCARERGAWGRLSGDGQGHYNPAWSEDPWGKAALAACTVVHQRTALLGSERGSSDKAARYTKDGCKPHDAKNSQKAGRHGLTCRPSSRTGENPPYGMIGETRETSASFEAWSAPLSYPTTYLFRIGRISK